MIAQREESRNALMLAAYRLGVRCTRRSVPPTGWGTDDIEEICFHTTPHIHTRHMQIGKGRCDVWCVTTESGTFTAWSDVPYLTGNSYSSPELQQFSADARPILCDDGQGLTSIDWSQIEPVTMGLLAKDAKFLDPYERGEDLYEPLMRAAGVDRKLAKVVLLASMYGQGDAAMAGRIGQSQTRAAQIRRQINSAMPRCAAWMTGQQDWAEKAGSVITAGGRMLPVDSKGAFRAVNYVVQGSAYDVLAYSIVEMERRGIGDSLHLAMHDEVVVDTPVADEVREIMQTPPDFLINAAGRTPVLRTDRADMGHAWAKV